MDASMRADEVADGLWVGDLECARSSAFFRSRNIVCAVAAGCGLDQEVAQACENVHSMELLDEESEDLITHLPAAIAFIRKHRQEGSSVLVYCLHGISRSVAVAAAYLMMVEHLDATSALTRIMAKRACACPNKGFVAQLHNFSEMQFSHSGMSQAHLRHRLLRLARTLAKEEKLANVYVPSVPESLACASTSFACRVCRSVIFTDVNCIQQSPPNITLEIMDWMLPQFCKGNKKLYCSCRSKLGSFDFCNIPFVSIASKTVPCAVITSSKLDICAAR
mmetsp:Transcript_1422/g.4239  ORF Transcript_1422/g.4239 Transcript_1422/m.4239 type:complete len:278 (-) Transcript_1422:1214-2047(-)